MTPAELAAQVTKGWQQISTTNFAGPGSGPRAIVIENGGEWACELIADAIRAAVAAERERCAKVAEDRAVFHRDNCHKSCACANGWHIALSIRAGEQGTA